MHTIPIRFNGQPSFQITQEGTAHIKEFLRAYTAALNENVLCSKMNSLLHDFDLARLMEMPCHVYAKDKKGTYILCNDNQAINTGFIKGNEVIGKKDDALCWGSYAKILLENDKEVSSTGNTKLCFETVRLKDNVHRVTFNCKTPLYTLNGKTIGIFGISMLSGIHDLSSKNFLKKNLFTKQMSQRQYECLYHLARGKTAKQIALILNISHRTVEEHLAKIKNKWNFQNRSQLIERAIDLGLLS